MRREIYSVPAQSLPTEAVHKKWHDLMPGSLFLALLTYSVFLAI